MENDYEIDIVDILDHANDMDYDHGIHPDDFDWEDYGDEHHDYNEDFDEN
jgi:hypothetical protein